MSLPPSSAPTATGWSDSCRAGFAPAEEWRLRTAHQLGDVPELLVAVRMRGAGELLVVDAQRIAHCLEQSGDRLGADVDAEPVEFVGEFGGGAGVHFRPLTGSPAVS